MECNGGVMSSTWNGITRRKNDIIIVNLQTEVRILQRQMEIFKSQWISEFGGKDEIGGKETEGNIYNLLKSINTQVTLTNGKVKKLWDWRNYVLGAIAMFGFIVALIEAHTK